MDHQTENKILIKLGELTGKVHTGFIDVNKRLDTLNGYVAEHGKFISEQKGSKKTGKYITKIVMTGAGLVIAYYAIFT